MSNIDELLKPQNAFKVENLPKLEAYVEDQVKDAETYNLDANLAVLRLYQFNPSKTNNGVVAKILTKSLMRLPNADFLTCSYLVSEEAFNDSRVKEIFNLSNILETGDFKEFWTAVKVEDLEKYLSTFSGFYDAIRNHICGVVALTFQTTTLPFLQAVLGLDAAAVRELAKKHGWNEEGDQIATPNIALSTYRHGRASNLTTLENLSTLLQTIS